MLEWMLVLWRGKLPNSYVQGIFKFFFGQARESRNIAYKIAIEYIHIFLYDLLNISFFLRV